MLGLPEENTRGDYVRVGDGAIDDSPSPSDGASTSKEREGWDDDAFAASASRKGRRVSPLVVTVLAGAALLVGAVVGGVGTHFVDIATSTVRAALPERVWPSTANVITGERTAAIDATIESLSDFLPNLTYVISAASDAQFADALKRNHIPREQAVQLTCGKTPGLEDCKESHKATSCKINHFFSTTKIEFSNKHWFVKMDQDVTLTPHFYEVIAELASCDKPQLQMWTTFMSRRFKPYPHGPIYAGNVLPNNPDTCHPEDTLVGKTAPDDLEVYDAGLLIQDGKYGYARNAFCWIIASHGEVRRKTVAGTCHRRKPHDLCSSTTTVAELREMWQAGLALDDDSTLRRMVKRVV